MSTNDGFDLPTAQHTDENGRTMTGIDFDSLVGEMRRRPPWRTTVHTKKNGNEPQKE